MDRRNQCVPMDWNFQDGIGPVQNESPFMNVGRDGYGVKRTKLPHAASMSDTDDMYGTGSFREMSPSKTQPATLRAPAPSHTYLFHRQPSVDKPLPQRPQSQSQSPSRSQPVDFVTPQQKQPTFDFDTSGGETENNTPDGHADNEATPDTGAGTGAGMRNFFGRAPDSPSPKKNDKDKNKDRQSLLSKLTPWISNSPGRGEIPRGGPYSRKVEKRIRKQRSTKTIALVRRRKVKHDDDAEYIEDGDDNSDEEQVAQPKTGSKTARSRRPGAKSNEVESHGQSTSSSSVAAFFHWLEAHPNLPGVLFYYAQFLFNALWLFGVFYLMYAFANSVLGDIDEEARLASAEAMTEIALCAKNFRDNDCGGPRVVPAIVELCKNWERCMERDPTKVGRARQGAKAMAKIVNHFTDELSLKTILFAVLLFAGLVGGLNLAFFTVRSRLDAYHPPPRSQYVYPPATPSRHASAHAMMGGPGDYGHYTPHHVSQANWGTAGAVEPAPSGAYGRTPGAGWSWSPKKEDSALTQAHRRVD